MSKAEKANITSETEHQNPNRRTAMMLAVGAAVVASSPATAAASGALVAPQTSEGCLRCVTAWEHWMQGGLDDDEIDDRSAEFTEALRDYLDASVVMAPVQRLAELNVLWRLEAWQGDGRLGETAVGEEIELALQKTIEEITGMPRSPEAVWTLLAARGLVSTPRLIDNAPVSA